MECNNGKVETEFHFVMECNKLQNFRNELFFIITKSDPSFMHLDIFDKFLSSENNTCIIAKFIYTNYAVVFYITLNLAFSLFSSPTLSQPQ